MAICGSMENRKNTTTRHRHAIRVREFTRTARPILGILLLCLLLGSWRQRAREPVTLTYFRLGWFQPDEPQEAKAWEQRFIQETSIQLRNLPVPETTLDQLDLSRKLLQSRYGPDVLGLDLIWSGALARDLLDLHPYFASELSALDPRLLPGYIVDGRVVAIPNSVQIGVLEYRADLLREYGYAHPPRTWAELEKMAQRIQEGERAKGKKDFWGYVWQGAAAEALTCNALEWQASEGGGRIIENDRTISVNNPATIRAWQRAKRWIGWISPLSVLKYRELDSTNVFDSGRAAFVRIWGGGTITRGGLFRQSHRQTSLSNNTGYSIMPSGSAGSFGTLGGSGLAISQHSAHPEQAIELVRYIARAQIEWSNRIENSTNGQIDVYGRSSVWSSQEGSDKSNGQKSKVVSRPSSVTGHSYEQVTRAYIDAVHSVLSGKEHAAVAAAQLEKQLIKITGFRAGPPKNTE
jgi:trehalose/maltose transport system substrate-binding protein